MSGFLHKIIGAYARRREEPANKTIVCDQMDFSASCSRYLPAWPACLTACMRVPRHYLAIAFSLRIEMGGHARRSVLSSTENENLRGGRLRNDLGSRPGRNFASLPGAALKVTCPGTASRAVGRRSVLLCVTVHGPSILDLSPRRITMVISQRVFANRREIWVRDRPLRLGNSPTGSPRAVSS